MPLDLVLMGPPGAGKGTQAARVAAERGIPHIATGDILRAAVREGTPLGRQAKEIMARGELVPDDLMIGLIRNRLDADDTVDGFLLDGFPRTDAQARALDEMLAGLGRSLQGVLVFDLPLETLIARIGGRRVCRAYEHVYHVEHNPPRAPGVCDIDGSELYQREDDRPEVIRRRYELQWVQAARPVLDYYGQRALIHNVDARASREAVAAEVDRLLDRLVPA
jgi:adenylate kinase